MKLGVASGTPSRMEDERKLLLDSLERHALYYAAKGSTYRKLSEKPLFSGNEVEEKASLREMQVARKRLLDAAEALAAYDARLPL